MERLRERNYKHGHSARAGKSREYRAWRGAKTRCYNERNPKYPAYGGRGIKMCDRWRDSFPEFLRDMGPCPAGMTLGRKDNDGPYEPGNCRWETSKAQANNRRSSVLVLYNGEERTLQQWAELLGLKPGTLRHRLRDGWPLERALSSCLFVEVGRFKRKHASSSGSAAPSSPPDPGP